MGIIYVNSTVAARREMYADGRISPIHYWGYVPGPGDKLYCHRRNRFEILLRYYLGGLDLRLWLGVFFDLCRGRRAIYLVTPPDLLRGLPLLRRLFPKVRIVTWVYTAPQMRKEARWLRACDYLVCEGEGALAEARTMGYGEDRASLQLWGADPDFYAPAGSLPPASPSEDVLLFGLVSRDPDVVLRALPRADFSLVTTGATAAHMGLETTPRLKVRETPATYAELLTVIHGVHVTWIPLRPVPCQGAGITNVIESLLCGTTVVIADSSEIPETVLSLFGVYRYRAGDADSLLAVTRRALEDSRQGGADFRRRVRETAAPVLNGHELERTVRRALALPPTSP